MHGQTRVKRFRRCYSCNAKSHNRLWDENKCPVCGNGEGFWTSSHGEITTEEQALAARKPAEGKIVVREREIG